MKKNTITEGVENSKNILDIVRDLGAETPSMRAFALTMNISANRLYAMAKKPIAGAVYDPEATNWDSISEFTMTKLNTNLAADGEPEIIYTDLSALVAAAIEKDTYLKTTGARVYPSGTNTIEVDGVNISKRKSAMFEMGENASYLCFKSDPLVYAMVYQTESFTVIRPVHEVTGGDGVGLVEFASNELRVLSNATLNTKCVPPTTLKDAIADRFSGNYAERNKKVETSEGESDTTSAE